MPLTNTLYQYIVFYDKMDVYASTSVYSNRRWAEEKGAEALNDFIEARPVNEALYWGVRVRPLIVN